MSPSIILMKQMMSRPKDKDDYAETHVLDRANEMPDSDPDATVVLDEEYQRELEGGIRPSKSVA